MEMTFSFLFFLILLPSPLGNSNLRDLSCGPPPDIPNTVHGKGTLVYSAGFKLTYRCEEGYSSDKGETWTLKCGRDLLWVWLGEHPDPGCRRKQCQSFQVDHGQVTPKGDVNFNSTVRISCNPRFIMRGPGTLTCGRGGHWTEFPPTCREIRCRHLKDPDFGYILDKNISIGTTVKYVCNRGYNLVGDTHRMCLPNGTWTGIEGFCEPLDCGVPFVPLGTCNVTQKTVYPAMVSCMCEVGSQNEFILSCNTKGKWTPDVMDKCHKDCSSLIRLVHGKSKDCECDQGRTITCDNGTFVGGDPEACLQPCPSTSTATAKNETLKVGNTSLLMDQVTNRGVPTRPWTSETFNLLTGPPILIWLSACFNLA